MYVTRMFNAGHSIISESCYVRARTARRGILMLDLVGKFEPSWLVLIKNFENFVYFFLLFFLGHVNIKYECRQHSDGFDVRERAIFLQTLL